jgi:hypothetical protein
MPVVGLGEKKEKRQSLNIKTKWRLSDGRQKKAIRAHDSGFPHGEKGGGVMES